eukprot:7388836-Alexandrium_andersonii.AAC.1
MTTADCWSELTTATITAALLQDHGLGLLEYALRRASVPHVHLHACDDLALTAGPSKGTSTEPWL